MGEAAALRGCSCGEGLGLVNRWLCIRFRLRREGRESFAAFRENDAHAFAFLVEVNGADRRPAFRGGDAPVPEDVQVRLLFRRRRSASVVVIVVFSFVLLPSRAWPTGAMRQGAASRKELGETARMLCMQKL
jgi:hypothetical protein